MELQFLIDKLNIAASSSTDYMPVAVERQRNMGYLGTMFEHFPISGFDVESTPGTIELLAPFPNAPHTHVTTLLNILKSIDSRMQVYARVGQQNDKLEIIDVVNYSGLYAVIRGIPLPNR